MASWTDGPEYAPVERPAAFAAPDVEPLTGPPPQVDLSAGAPAARPASFDEPRDRVPALADLTPHGGPTRDPHRPYEVASAIVTAGSAWGSAHTVGAVAAPGWSPPVGPAWTADQPFESTYAPPTHGFPTPGTPQWFGPGPEWAPPAPTVPPTFANALKASSYGLLIVLAVGGLVWQVTPFALPLALSLTFMVRYRRERVRRLFMIALGVMLAGFAVPLLTGRSLDDAYGTAGMLGLFCCWVLALAVVYQQYTALNAGERPASVY